MTRREDEGAAVGMRRGSDDAYRRYDGSQRERTSCRRGVTDLSLPHQSVDNRMDQVRRASSVPADCQGVRCVEGPVSWRQGSQLQSQLYVSSSPVQLRSQPRCGVGGIQKRRQGSKLQFSDSGNYGYSKF